MSLPLRVLIVEDSENDALLMVRELQRNGYTLTYERVDTYNSMVAALDRQAWDVVLADYSLPAFSAPAALQLLQAKHLDLPFVIVSGSIGEATAVAAMKAGAHDYLMKGNLVRLVPAIERELREAQGRSQRRAAEQALRTNEERFRSLIENALDIITVVGEEGKVRYVSPSIERVLGYNPDDFLGQESFQYIHPDDLNLILAAFDTAIQTAGRTVYAEFRFRHRDDTWRVLEAVGKQFVEPGGSSSLVINARDITERKQVEEARKALQKEKELNDLKSQFVSMVSHEFRTPLSVIVLSATLLERFFYTANEEKRQEYLSRIQASAKHMTQLLDDVLFMGKTDADKQEFKPSPLDLAQFCQGLLEEVKLVSSADRTITFICAEASIPARMDEGLLRRILTNLLLNAVKYSATETTVRFQLSHTDTLAIFQIQDQGIGISEEDQHHLFESFHRGQNVGKIPGTGLGLAIVHQSVQLHGGTIAVQSQVNAGTTFTVELPLS